MVVGQSVEHRVEDDADPEVLFHIAGRRVESISGRCEHVAPVLPVEGEEFCECVAHIQGVGQASTSLWCIRSTGMLPRVGMA